MRSALEGSMPGAVADLIEAGLNEAAGLLGAMGIEAWALAWNGVRGRGCRGEWRLSGR